MLGDIGGKGPAAARTTALARYTLRADAVHEDRPSRILALLNGALRRQAPGKRAPLPTPGSSCGDGRVPSSSSPSRGTRYPWS